MKWICWTKPTSGGGYWPELFDTEADAQAQAAKNEGMGGPVQNNTVR